MITEENYKKLSSIKFLGLDVDGILTDGKVFWIEGTGWTRNFCVKDGYGIYMMRDIGVEVAFISAGNSESVRQRAANLRIQHTYLGSHEKLQHYDTICKKFSLKAEEFAYMGDDIFDMPVLEKAGFSATVPGAVREVRKIVDYVTIKESGNGAVREITDYIRYAKKGLSYAELQNICS